MDLFDCCACLFGFELSLNCEDICNLAACHAASLEDGMIKMIGIASLLIVGGCSQLGNTDNALCFVWIGKGTSAICTIAGAKGDTTSTLPTSPVVPLIRN